ncbi:phage tail protein [Tenacibaculum amylolyticum]|uniref:phage tail protein n=1 Tax=Tenacibaculum amylolyticum TaxID=104269 RepID=UPI0038934881
MNSIKKIIGLLFIAFCLSSTTANAQEPILGEVRIFAGNFAPRGWAFCEGQLLPIASNSALFSLLGTMYGGDGRTTFGLPDLRGRVAMSAGRHPGSSYTYIQGQRGGTEDNTLNTLNLPSHNHTAIFTQTVGIANISVVEDTANSDEPSNHHLAIPDAGGNNFIYSTGTPDATLAPAPVTVNGTVTTGLTGGSRAVENRQPYTVVRYIIALQGIFPSRN